MVKLLSKEDGERAVKLAREAIETYLEERKILQKRLDGVFSEKRGVFTTLTKHGNLRGCIGFPYPVKRLDEAIIESAIAAAVDDPRFEPVRLSEMDEIVVEVTILTPPEKIDAKPKDLPSHVEIGRHGLIVKMGPFSGLLLPQVAVEYNMDAEEFLSETCMKAGLPPDCWLTGAEVYRFEGQIFKEKEPRGEVVEVDIKSCEV
ncbi:MAG: TIGR00296 family protein [Archaeoglobus sp.]|uniref:TIGR00296 family protein n=1 Tax=Archaeoglobus sp. TaxID=1872626 RepID=UPI001DFBEDE8|nr:TIGR00296 family protein [Archaeoglobus sp.]MBO8179355.1 TIGR00296 family protein [Archaeoglobus sp.]